MEWAECGFFLLKHVEIKSNGHWNKGLEVIGHHQQPGGTPSAEINSRFYSYIDRLTQQYVYHLDGDHLKIWFRDKESNNIFTGTFLDDDHYAGAW